jgi:hypothetical protein
MSIRTLSQIVLSVSLMFAAVFCTTMSAQDVASRVLPFVPSRVTEHVDETRRVTLLGNTHPLARAAYDRGLVEAGLPMDRIVMVLKRSPEQQAALDAFDERLYDPKSPDFHQWMHAEEFGKTYGPSDADIATVTGWLQSHGFSIYNVSKGRVTIEFSGTAAQVQETFHTEIHKYLVNGVSHVANDRDPSIPEALAPVVSGIASLHDFRSKHESKFGDYIRRNTKTGVFTRISPQPTSAASLPERGDNGRLGLLAPNVVGEPKGQTPKMQVTPQLGYSDSNGVQAEMITPYDYATIYNLLPLWNSGINGKGVTIAIVGVSDVVESDFNTFRSSFGLPATKLNTIVNGTDPGVNGGQVENTLDVEMAGSSAPGATIDLVVSSDSNSTSGDILSALYITDNEIAPIMTGSYGECELALGTSENTMYNQTWQQGATAGISIFESAGDEGAAGCNSQNENGPYADSTGLAVNGIASSPYVTAVGGTDLTWSFTEQTTPISTYWNSTNAAGTLTSAKGYMPEMVWNSTCTNPILLNYFLYSDGSQEFSNTEDLCNAAANNDPYDNIVRISAGLGGKSSCTAPSGSTSATCTGGYAKPSWQTGVGVPADGKRDLPDVSTFASYGFRQSVTGIESSQLLLCAATDSPETSCDYSNPDYIVYQENGGTSAATPLTAGVMALVIQKTGQAQGLANPVFYQLAAAENYANCNSQTVTAGNSCVFYDITFGTNSQVCQTGGPNCVTNTSGDQYGELSGYAAGKGFDQATGLGSINVNNLVNAWPTTSSASTLTFTPTSLTFPSTAVGSTSAALSVTLKNTGTSAATISNIQLTGSTAFGNTSTTCTTTLASGASCAVSLTFTPAATGTFTAVLTFTDSATGSPQTVNISGTGGNASTGLTITPSSLTFASTTVGTSAATQVITLTNNTSSAVTFTGSTTITGAGASSFAKTASTCGTLAAGASCTNTITFTPQSAGSLTATVTYHDSASTTGQTVALSGTGASASTGLTITPSSLTFASTTVGTSAATQVITLTNNTSSAVTFTGSTTITGAGASSFAKTASTCGTLAAGASCTNTITFTPQSAGSLTATVTYHDSASTTSQTVALSGTGAGASSGLTITPSSLTFASTTVGTSAATQVITLTNNTSSAVSFTASTTITGSAASSFAKSASTCPNPLAAGASCTNTITFTPQSAGALAATVTYTDSASTTGQTVALYGTGAGTSTGLTITPSSLTFPSTTVGSSAATQIITLKNNTSAAVSFTASTTITGSGASSFAKTASTCSNPLPAGASCTNTITFTPQSAGALAATVTYTDSASTTGQTVSLSGTGASAGAGLTITPTSLTFASTAVGTSAATQVITLNNSTSAAVSFTAATTITGTNAGSFAKTASTCSNPLPAGASCTNTITFTPQATGALAATVTYTDSASTTGQTVALYGAGH